jgi:hypothetical protein
MTTIDQAAFDTDEDRFGPQEPTHAFHPTALHEAMQAFTAAALADLAAVPPGSTEAAALSQLAGAIHSAVMLGFLVSRIRDDAR